MQNRSEAAEHDFGASEMNYKFARLSLAAGVASAWFRTIETKQQLELAEKKVKTIWLFYGLMYKKRMLKTYLSVEI